MPNAQPVYRSLSMPAASSTLGCTMPEPRISIQPVPLHAGHPRPPQMPHCTSISADGSVNGKYDGRKRVRDAPKNPLGETVERRLEIDEADAFVDAESFDLRERRRVRRVEEVAAIDGARDENANRRRVLLQRAHLHRRRVRAQQSAALAGTACRARRAPDGSAGS